MRILLGVFLLTLLLPVKSDLILHKEKSLYRNILVQQKGDRRCLVFSVKRQMRNQTCIDVNKPSEIVFAYVRMSLAGLLVNPTPQRGLMIGIGGGTISNVLTELYPSLTMDLVEIDGAVIKVAEAYFDFKETPQTKVHIVDGRVFVRRAVRKEERYDFIILDAFSGEYIPEHLMTKEFLDDVKRLLTPGGVVVANTFSRSNLYDHESQTYAAVFGDFLNFKLRGSGNRVIVASNAALPDTNQLEQTAEQLREALSPYAVDPRVFIPRLERQPDWNTNERILTDQYSPANLLRGSIE